MSLRIASLVPAGTDLVAALGLAEHLVGVSHECDHPAAEGLPVLTSSNIAAAGLDADVDAAAVDAEVTATLSAGDALYRTDMDELARLDPDVVVSQQICDVCAVTATSVLPGLPTGTTLVTLTATSIEQLNGDLRAVADACGVRDAAEGCITEMSERLGALAAPASKRPRVATIEWGDPPFVGGHWVPEIVARSGGDHLLAGPGDPSRRSSWAEIVDADPDVVVYLPCGYLLDVAMAEAEATVPPELRAKTWVADANRLFSRLTPVAAEAAEGLAMILQGAEPPPASFRRLVGSGTADQRGQAPRP